MREISAGIIIFRKTKDGPKFLLLYHGGKYWNFPKGKLEEAESSYTAAIREIKEETGLGQHDLKFNSRFKIYDRFIFTQKRQKVFKTVIYFLAETRNPIIKISKEHQGYGWFLHSDGARMLIYQNLKQNLKMAYDIIIQRKSISGGRENPARQGSHLQGNRQGGREALCRKSGWECFE